MIKCAYLLPLSSKDAVVVLFLQPHSFENTVKSAAF